MDKTIEVKEVSDDEFECCILSPKKHYPPYYSIRIGRYVITLCQQCVDMLEKEIHAALKDYYDEGFTAMEKAILNSWRSK